MRKNILKLGVNIDHIATLRNARDAAYMAHPHPERAIEIIKSAGADGITIHLREDRRHIIDDDVYAICKAKLLPVNLEMAATQEMVNIALRVLPSEVCFVPEKRSERTTESGIDLSNNTLFEKLRDFVPKLQNAGIKVALFLDPAMKMVSLAAMLGANIVEIHTGNYANNFNDREICQNILAEISAIAKFCVQNGIVCHAGHGLNYTNIRPIGNIDEISMVNIGHFLIGEAVFVGMENAIREMVKLIRS